MIFDPDSSALVIFCKRPVYGTGKQRIAASLDKTAALECSRLLLAATLEDARDWPGPVVIAPASAEDAAWAEGLLPGAKVIPQPPGTLGERLQEVDQRIRAAGGRSIIFIGTDSPALSTEILDSAAQALQKHDAVLMPALDGGVTLMASRLPWPPLSPLPWETEKLGEALANTCRDAAFDLEILPQGYDVDTENDLRLAAADLADDPRAGRRALCEWINATIRPAMDISVVVPVLHDLAALQNLLIRLREMNGIREIIVVDAGKEAECRQMCEKMKARYLRADPCRGAQLHLGAQHCKGDILWFLHADSQPAQNATEKIAQHIAGGHHGGYFRFSFLGEPMLVKDLLAACINVRTRIGTPYGDQGLFVRRDAYTQTGGFAATPLFEEVSLVRALRRQFRFGEVDAKIGVSPRRWERDGWLRRSIHNRYLALAFMLGTPADKLVRRYQHDGASE